MARQFLKPFLILVLTGLIGLAGAAGPLSAQKQKTRDLVYEEEAESGGDRQYSLEQRREILSQGHSLYSQKKYKEAAAHYERFLPAVAAQIGDQPGVVQAKIIWGYCRYKANQPPRKTAELMEPVIEKYVLPLDPAEYKLFQAQGLTALAEARLGLGRPRESAEMAARALEILKRLDDPKKTNSIDALHVLAQATTAVKDFDQGIELYRLIIKLEKAAYPPPAHNPIFTATALAGVLADSGRPEEALALLNADAKAIKGRKYHYIVVQNNIDAIATTLYRMGRYEEALAKYKEGLAIFEKAGRGDSNLAAMVYADLAKVTKSLGRYEEAVKLGERALDLHRRHLGPESPLTIRLAIDLAAIYDEAGRLDRALEVLDETLPTAVKAYGETGKLTIDLNLTKAAHLMTVGENEASLALFEKYLPDAEKTFGENDPMLIAAYNNIGALYGNLPGEKPENKRKCYQYMDKAAQAVRRLNPPEHPQVLEADRALAQAAMDNKDLDRAEAILRDLAPLAQKVYGEEHRQYFRILRQQAVLYKNKGEIERAIGLLKEILPGVTAVGDQWDVMFTCRNLSDNYLALNRLDEAAFYGRQAVAAGQKLRQSLARAKPDLRRSLARRLTNTYQALADVLMKQNKIAEAQAVMALLKVEELADLTAPPPAAQTADKGRSPARAETPAESGALLAGMDPELAGRYREISDRLVELGREQQGLMEKRRNGQTLSPKEEARLKQLRQDMGDARKVFSAFTDNLSKELAGKSDAGSDLANLEIYQRLLSSMGEGTVLIQTIVTPDRLWLILTTDSAIVAKESPLEVKKLPQMVADFREVLKDDANDARPLAREFYRALVAPLAESLRQAKARTIMFSLDGQLRYIPMAALHDGQRWLVEDYALALFNDATKAALAVPPAGGQWQVAGLGVSKAHKIKGLGTFPALTAVEGELGSIVKGSGRRGILPGTVTMDEGFTSETLAEVLESGYSVVHVASHFHFDARNPEKSFLLLGDGSGLSLGRIETEDFKFKNVDLLALSACQTARGGPDATGKEIEGLGALAQRRGARAVLATLWPVFDDSTGLLMSTFYKVHADDQARPDLARSLRQAQLTMINNEVKGEDFRHPFFWAPFVLMGDWR